MSVKWTKVDVWEKVCQFLKKRRFVWISHDNKENRLTKPLILSYAEMVQIFIWKCHCLFRIWLSALQKHWIKLKMDCMIDVICCVFRESHLLPRTQLSHKKIDHSYIYMGPFYNQCSDFACSPSFIGRIFVWSPRN